MKSYTQFFQYLGYYLGARSSYCSSCGPIYVGNGDIFTICPEDCVYIRLVLRVSIMQLDSIYRTVKRCIFRNISFCLYIALAIVRYNFRIFGGSWYVSGACFCAVHLYVVLLTFTVHGS